MSDLKREIQEAINRASRENASNTPDFILAEFLMGCLCAFEAATNERRTWFAPGGVIAP